jgi:hypothetical protein
MVDAGALTDLGEQLRSPDGGALRDQVTARFDRIIRQVQDAMATGVSVDEYGRLRRIQRAVETARQVVGSYT